MPTKIKFQVTAGGQVLNATDLPLVGTLTLFRPLVHSNIRLLIVMPPDSPEWQDYDVPIEAVLKPESGGSDATKRG